MAPHCLQNKVLTPEPDGQGTSTNFIFPYGTSPPVTPNSASLGAFARDESSLQKGFYKRGWSQTDPGSNLDFFTY